MDSLPELRIEGNWATIDSAYLSVASPEKHTHNLATAGVSPFADAVEAARAGLITCSFNPKITRLPRNKAEKAALSKIATGWQQTTLRYEQAFARLNRGEAIAPVYEGGHRSNENVRLTPYLCIEIDAPVIDKLRAHEVTQRIKNLNGVTPSGYCRALYLFDKPMDVSTPEKREAFKALALRFLYQFRDLQPDRSSIEPARFFFGFRPGSGQIAGDEWLTLEALAALPEPPREWLISIGKDDDKQKQRAQREHTERLPRKAAPPSTYDQPKNRRLIDDVAERVSMEAGAYRHTDNRGDEWIEFNDPRRGEKHHSIGFNVSKGFFWNFYTEQAEPLYQWCQYYGIDINRYPGGLYEPDSLPVEPTTPAPEAVPVEAAEPRYWAGGLPDAVRATLRQYHKPTLAPFAECVHELVRSGQLDPDAITVNAVIERAAALGFTFAERTARELLKTSGLFRQNPDIEKRHLDTMSDFCRNSTGRPATTYALLTPPEIKQELLARARFRIFEQTHESDGGLILAQPTAAMMESTGLAGDDSRTVAKTLGDYLQPAFEKQDRAERRAAQRALQTYQALQFDLENDHSTPLPTGWKYDTPKDYAAAHARALVAGTEDSTLSYREMSARLGVERSAVPLVLRRAGIENEQRTERRALSPGQDVERQIRRHAGEAKGYPARLIVQHADGKEGAFDYANADPDTARAFVRNCWAKGASVSVELRVASRQRIVTDGQPERKPAEPTEQKPAAPVTRENAEPAHYEASYNPAWLRRQYRKAMELMNWRKADDGRFVTPDGAPVEPDASASELLALLLEQAGADRRLIDRLTGRENLADDPLFEAALELGGAVYRITEQGRERVL